MPETSGVRRRASRSTGRLTLRDVAEQVGLHESTVSRVTTQKYMLTTRGIFELKYFFGSHVATDTGGACSATAIRALIKQMVAAEDGRIVIADIDGGERHKFHPNYHGFMVSLGGRYGVANAGGFKDWAAAVMTTCTSAPASRRRRIRSALL